MVNYALPALALLALSTSVAATPTFAAERATSTTPFTFIQWIEDIIANPNGEHLTPEDAVAAKNAAVTAANPLTKRVNCRDDIVPANANDAAACLNYLAGNGNSGIDCGMGQFDFVITMCRIGSASVIASKGSSPSGVSTNCNTVARTGGLIFDSCWRVDNTVRGSEQYINNGGFQVNISG